jgi:putative lipoprotein
MLRGFLLLLAATLLAGCGGTKPLVDKPTYMRTIDGTVTYRERVSLNSGAVLQVWLLDAEWVGAQSKTLVSSTISNPGQVPILFTLDYDPAWIIAGHIYTMRAEIRDRGRLLFMSDRPVPVEPDDDGDRVKLMLIRASGRG